MRTGLVLERLASALGAEDRGPRAAGRAGPGVDLAGLPDDILVERRRAGAEARPFADGLAPAAIWAAAVRDLTAASARRLEASRPTSENHDRGSRSAGRLDAQRGGGRREAPPARPR